VPDKVFVVVPAPEDAAAAGVSEESPPEQALKKTREARVMALAGQ
jgi:hypothetical protein